ncbi:ECF transporter S component [Nocardioides sp. Kera G14]|uniref:ECF transporter S component n=1 Tax=Nocardioides sp. Kera G14 TaxID=2884264 RepID=UPI001D0F52A6|nr:ECF transporter S component [Nocardioides sp. Kera G14]UDY24536.1 ECF transporter S component [Nocardioides sp. Kera G14]
MTRMIRLSARSAFTIAIASIFGLITLAWPLLVNRADGQLVQPPWVFMLLLPIVVLVVVAELSEDGLDARALAILGVLSAVDAILRGLSAGTAGVEFVFFLIILGGRVYGPAFGFVLGCTSLFASALLTAGVGPWLPYQMLCSAWIGLGAGLLPRRITGRVEIAVLAAYGVVVSFLYGLLLNLQGWPMLAGVSVPGHHEPLAFDPSASFATNVVTFLRYTLVTSTTSYDLMRALTTAVAIVVLGGAVMTTLRRAARRATVTGEIRDAAPAR